MYIKRKEPVSGTLDARLLTDLHRHTDRNTNKRTDMTNYMTVVHPTTISSSPCEIGDHCEQA